MVTSKLWRSARLVGVGIAATVVFAALLVLALTAIVPVRRPPLSTFSFMIGFVAGELAGQGLALTVVLAAVLDDLGWPSGAVGTVALVAALSAAAAFGALLGCALGSRATVARALTRARGIEVARVSSPPGWLRWWRTWLAVPWPGAGVHVHRDLVYLDDGDPAHRLDVLVPRAGATGAPVMVFVHGGAWTIGSKEQQCRPMLFELAARGWVVVSCNYRLSPTATWPDHIVDVKRVLAWTRSNVAAYGGDAARFLGISGNSAGGHLAALAALTPGEVAWQPGFEDADTAVDACVSIYGVLDMTGDPDIAGPQGRALQSLLGHSVIKQRLDDAHDTYEASSPLHRLSEGAPPFLVVHGTKDTLVSVGVARAFVAAFERVATAPICYVELPWAQHGFDTLCSPRCSATVVGIARFLDALVGARTPRQVP
ncbi:MAG TPA: alpha/beta hydrolase [Acidimicrobiales bacterium]|jgi:acetyl esterase/lipase|nr:alpha/beta hydrolase [Acidimicrobiales bacterium]